jgi:ubiquinone/menaquinone biosynthesis C-methylase UbiE
MKNNTNSGNLLKYKLYNFDYLVLKRLLCDFIHVVDFYLKDKKDLKIVDIGCGVKPYFHLFRDKAIEYTGVDIMKSETVDIVAPGEKLPLFDNYFDVAISTQVLEHTMGYQSAINEIYRVLKKDGIAFFLFRGFGKYMVPPTIIGVLRSMG